MMSLSIYQVMKYFKILINFIWNYLDYFTILLNSFIVKKYIMKLYSYAKTIVIEQLVTQLYDIKTSYTKNKNIL